MSCTCGWNSPTSSFCMCCRVRLVWPQTDSHNDQHRMIKFSIRPHARTALILTPPVVRIDPWGLLCWGCVPPEAPNPSVDCKTSGAAACLPDCVPHEHMSAKSKSPFRGSFKETSDRITTKEMGTREYSNPHHAISNAPHTRGVAGWGGLGAAACAR